MNKRGLCFSAMRKKEQMAASLKLEGRTRFDQRLKLLLMGLALLLLLLSAAQAPAQAVTDEVTVGTPWQGEPGVQESVADIMQREFSGQFMSSAKKQRVLPFRTNPLRQGNPQSPEAMASLPWPVSGLATEAWSYSPDIVTSTSFTAATLADTGAFPPDSMGAVGPTQFILAVNGRIRSFNKSTGEADGILNTTPDNFFISAMTPPTASNFTSDPRIRYDRLSGRWFITIIDVPGGTGALPNRVLIAVSDSSSISVGTVWTFFYFQHDLVSPAGETGMFADYPTLGIDSKALYIGVNVFTAAGAFNSTTGFVVRKSSVLGAGPMVVTAFRGLVPTSTAEGPYTPQGVDNYDPDANEGYFIGVSNAVFSSLVLRRVSDPGGTPAISANISIIVPTTTTPKTVPHLGNTGSTNGYLDALDDRLYAAHIRNGKLWTAHNFRVSTAGVANAASASRNGVRWYELTGISSPATPSLVQSGTVFDSAASNPLYYWIPSIMVSGQGHAAVGFSAAGANSHINGGIAYRLSGDTLGTMQAPQLFTNSTFAYNPAADPGGASGRRWGDYSYTSLDPDDDMTIWTVQEWCDATNSYGLRVVKLPAPPPATPSAVPAVAAGQASVGVTLTGTSSAGSGFFDPGPGFSGHISAVVSGGVTVNSVTYIDPTHITLDLSTVGATLGGKTVTVTNPDGQSAASATPILTVLDGTAPVPGSGLITNTYGSFVGSPFDLSMSFTDNESTVTGCEYTTNGTTWLPATVLGTGPVWTCSQMGLTAPDGAVLTLNMRATSTGGTAAGLGITRTVDAAAPIGGTLTAIQGFMQLDLNWPGFSDGGSGLRAVNTYLVVRSELTSPSAKCTDGTQVYLGTGNSKTDTGLVNGTSYFYRVCAYDNIGNVSEGATVTAAPKKFPVRKISGAAFTYYDTVTEAYVSIIDGDRVQLMEGDLGEDILLDQQAAISLEGGLGGDFGSVVGESIIRSLSVKLGTATLSSLVIR